MFAKFLSNPYTIAILKERNSIHIKIILFFAKYFRVGLYMYNNMTKRIKNANA